MPAAITRPRDAKWLLDEAPALINPAAAAEVAGLDRQTMNRIIETGCLPVIRVGSRVRIPRASLLRLLDIADTRLGAA